MKVLFLSICLLFSIQSIAQVKFESPYVSDGVSFEFTFPKGMQLIGEVDDATYLYSADPTMTVDQLEAPKKNAYIVGLLQNDEAVTMEELIENPEMFEEEGFRNIERLTSANGTLFLMAEGEIEIDEDFPVHALMGATIFNEALVLVMYVDVEKKYLSNPYSDLKPFLQSYRTYQTNRENTFEIYDYSEYDDYDEMMTFENSKFETDLFFENIFFEAEMEEETLWTNDFEGDYPELLTAYVYQTSMLNKSQEEVLTTEAGVKVFSGGAIDKYSSDGAKLKALQVIFPSYDITAISPSEKLEGMYFSFQKYTATSNSPEELLGIYSVAFEEEMLFILTYKTDAGSANIGAECESFILGLNPY